jgi:primosomal protein N' (replication factor Y)
MEQHCFASVVLDNALDKALDYSIPLHLAKKIAIGVRVIVPLRSNLRHGTVFDLKPTSEIANIQPIADLASDKALIERDLFQLIHWISKYYGAPLRKTLSLILPPSVRKGMEEKKQLYIKSLVSRPELAALCLKKSPPQVAVLEVMLKHPGGILLTELLEKSNVSRSPVQTLEKEKILSFQSLEIDRSLLLEAEFFQTKSKQLNVEQKSALDKVRVSLDQNSFETHLLHGVTGSGKTEIYLQAIEHALAQHKSALLLVPEIALTSQTVERLKSRFNRRIAILHHRLSDGERRDTWHRIHSGEIVLVVGARSALFSPLQRLGLIIVDEEHEPSYKQSDDIPCYHARDVAVMRGKFCHATVILGSATPSLESYYNALSGKYTLSELTVRPGHAQHAQVKLIDIRNKKINLFSEELLGAIDKRLKIGEQTLIFLNRRGFHTSQQCQLCGHIAECPHCSLSLTFHKGANSLACHLCNYEISPPPRCCPQCNQPESLKYKGAGTEQVERALHAIFPGTRTLRLDADTTRHKGSHEKLFKQFRAGKADILIGTQMVAKGLHFPSVTLVGVLNADASLQLPDFRATEHVFQILTQVAGRSGRGALSGEVLIQTYQPENPTILHAAAQDYQTFYQEEIETRRFFYFPPFARLVKISFSGISEKETEDMSIKVRQFFIQGLPPTYQIHPVVPCGHAKIKDHYRFQFLIRGSSSSPVTALYSSIPIKSSKVRMVMDVDPLSTFF